MREETEFIPKPMVRIGGKPVLWHIMKHFASYGHTDFIICGGYKVEAIKSFFFSYFEQNLDFTVVLGDPSKTVFHGPNEESGWKITVLDTGLDSTTGSRLLQAQAHLDDDKFFCTYGDGVAPVNLQSLIATHSHKATMTVTRPENRFGIVDFNPNEGKVTAFREKPRMNSLVNIGFFVFEPDIFEVLNPNEMLEEGALGSLAKSGDLGGYVHEGFWQPLDTFREYQSFNNLWGLGRAPWKTWT